MPDMREKIKEYILELDQEIIRVEQYIENHLTENTYSVRLMRG